MPKAKPKVPSSGAALGWKSVEQLQAAGKIQGIAWKPWPAQERVLLRREFEIFVGGSKFGGKTECGRVWMIQGNPDRPDFDQNGQPLLVNQSYIHHPHFLGAVIRLNEKDLAEWVDRAKPLYEGVLGGSFTKNPTECRWPSGARVFCGHMGDSDAWTKYQGQNIVRFLIEEACQIPDLDLFDLVRSCCRSNYPDMLAQILLTANPGGPGQPWIFDRYIEPKDREGKPVKHPTEDRPITQDDKGMIPILEHVQNPFSGEMLSTTRIWVPSYLTDNPDAVKNTNYIAVLSTMRDEKMRRAYIFGDWTAFRGTYFDMFTRETHTFNPANRPVLSWWKATGSLDWGFVHKSAAYKHKRDPETRQHLVYDEFTTSRTDPVELGKALANWWMPELRVQSTVVLAVSHDLFHNKIGEFTWADLVAKGVQQVLGKDSCYLPEQLVRTLKEKYQIEGREWTDEMEARIHSKQIQGIVLRKAPTARAVGFMHIRNLMRIESAGPAPESPDWDFALKVMSEGTAEDYVRYIQSFQGTLEVLPELLISEKCPYLIAAIPKAIHSDENPEDIQKGHFAGADELDSLRYLMGYIRDERPTDTPWQLERERLRQQAMMRNPTMSVQEMIYLSKEIEEAHGREIQENEGFCLGRASRAIRRINASGLTNM